MPIEYGKLTLKGKYKNEMTKNILIDVLTFAGCSKNELKENKKNKTLTCIMERYPSSHLPLIIQYYNRRKPYGIEIDIKFDYKNKR